MRARDRAEVALVEPERRRCAPRRRSTTGVGEQRERVQRQLGQRRRPGLREDAVVERPDAEVARHGRAAACAASSAPPEYAAAASTFERSTARRAVKAAAVGEARTRTRATVDRQLRVEVGHIASTKPTSSAGLGASGRVAARALVQVDLLAR